MFLFAATQVSTVIVDYKFYYLNISFHSLARDCLATLPKENKKAEISGIILVVMNIETGF